MTSSTCRLWASSSTVADDFLDPHRHLPTDPLLLFGGPVTPDWGRVVAVPTGRVLQGVAHAVYALLAQNLQQTGDALTFHLFEGL